MPDIEMCPECRVPRHITGEHVWLENGVIGSRRDETHRLVFFESGILDPVFKDIARVVGKPIDDLVINAARLSTREYVDRLLPEDVKSLVRSKQIDVQLVINSAFQLWSIMGYGKITPVGVRLEYGQEDFITALIEKPYSAPLSLGNFAGSIEAWVEAIPFIDYKKVSPIAYEVTITRNPHPEGHRKKLGWKGYKQELKPGDIKLERCATCGGPEYLSEFQWDLESGIVRSTSTGRRMVMIGPSMIDPILDELEEELGESVRRVVIEAERRFVQTGFVSIDEVVDEEYIRKRIALRGLGNISNIDIDEKRVRIRLENAALHLMGVGIAQGFFELAFNVESEVDWELSKDGVLDIEVRPRIIQKAVGG